MSLSWKLDALIKKTTMCIFWILPPEIEWFFFVSNGYDSSNIYISLISAKR